MKSYAQNQIYLDSLSSTFDLGFYRSYLPDLAAEELYSFRHIPFRQDSVPLLRFNTENFDLGKATFSMGLRVNVDAIANFWKVDTLDTTSFIKIESIDKEAKTIRGTFQVKVYKFWPDNFWPNVIDLTEGRFYLSFTEI